MLDYNMCLCLRLLGWQGSALITLFGGEFIQRQALIGNHYSTMEKVCHSPLIFSPDVKPLSVISKWSSLTYPIESNSA